jgi:hypothetical protein
VRNSKVYTAMKLSVPNGGIIDRKVPITLPFAQKIEKNTKLFADLLI